MFLVLGGKNSIIVISFKKSFWLFLSQNIPKLSVNTPLPPYLLIEVSQILSFRCNDYSYFISTKGREIVHTFELNYWRNWFNHVKKIWTVKNNILQEKLWKVMNTIVLLNWILNLQNNFQISIINIYFDLRKKSLRSL